MTGQIILQILRDHRHNPGLLYPSHLSFTLGGEREFTVKQNLFSIYLQLAKPKALQGQFLPKESKHTEENRRKKKAQGSSVSMISVL